MYNVIIRKSNDNKIVSTYTSEDETQAVHRAEIYARLPGWYTEVMNGSEMQGRYEYDVKANEVVKKG